MSYATCLLRFSYVPAHDEETSFSFFEGVNWKKDKKKKDPVSRVRVLTLLLLLLSLLLFSITGGGV